MDASSIKNANQIKDSEGLKNITYQCMDADSIPKNAFDFILTFNVIHDTAKPIQILKAIYSGWLFSLFFFFSLLPFLFQFCFSIALTPNGAYLMVEPNSADKLEDNIGPQ